MKKILLAGALVALFGLTAANAQTASVTFNCNMAVKICEQSFAPGTDSVQIRGSFDGWGAGVKLESNEAGDSIWTTTMDLNVTDTIYFKFYTTHGSGVWEDDPNRMVIVPEGGTTFTDYFNRDSVCNPVGSSDVFFTVDMTAMQDAGIFDAASDSVIISASFNGWSTTTDENTQMGQDPDFTNLWTKNVSFVNEPLGADEAFKYVVKPHDPIWTDGYERPLSQGGGNRDFIYDGSNIILVPVNYDDIFPELGIPAGTNLQVTFSVDMTTATSPDSQAVPFNPDQDTVYWISEEPAFQVTQGWTTDGRIRQVQMIRQGSTNIFQGTFTLQDPSFNAFEYRYAYVSGSDGSVIYEAGGFQDFAYRVRFAEMSAPHVVTNPFTFTQDTWTNSTVKVNENFPLGLNVRPESHIAKDYRLLQNYPNPFNPTTIIKFSIPERNQVTIKIYNALGQLVKNLVNGEYNSGTYRVSFNATGLSSGIYFYQISAGNYQATKKMILLK
jgi:hypothetical protein